MFYAQSTGAVISGRFTKATACAGVVSFVTKSQLRYYGMGRGGGMGDWGAGIAQWLEHRTRDRKVEGFQSQQERRDNFLLQGHLSVLTLI